MPWIARPLTVLCCRAEGSEVGTLRPRVTRPTVHHPGPVRMPLDRVGWSAGICGLYDTLRRMTVVEHDERSSSQTCSHDGVGLHALECQHLSDGRARDVPVREAGAAGGRGLGQGSPQREDGRGIPVDRQVVGGEPAGVSAVTRSARGPACRTTIRSTRRTLFTS